MSLKRLLRYLNILVAAALLVALAFVYWFIWRVLPSTTGEIAAPLLAQASITRDSLGVPHVAAETIEDALFLQGYATAQDRLWQMDAIRRYAAGELSEVVGPAALEADRESRRLRTRRIAEEHYRSMDPVMRSKFAAYARGVNFFMETHRRALPLEFAVLRYDPRPWSVVDTILAGLHMFRDLTTTWQDETQKRALLTGGDARLVEQIFPVRTGAEFQPGSNAWALAGRHTASGKPILANDTHLQFSMPATWYMNHLHTPAMDVTGFSLPGVPGIIIGHNQRIAWGLTNLHYDVQDLYIEKLNLQTGRYVFRGLQQQARAERERIPVRNQPSVEFVNWVTGHGPVWSTAGGEILTLKWTAAEPGGFHFPFFDINAARNWEEFRRALRSFPGPGQNFVYADAGGNIGYQAAGKLPLRRRHSGDLPVDGSSGDFEWEDFIPFEDLPAAFNPASGVILTANQNPFPAGFPHRVNGNFAPPYRSRQIRDLLAARQNWRPEELLAVQKDVYSTFSHFLARQTLAAYEQRGTRNPALAEPAAVLRSWNGQMEKSHAAPLLVSLIYQHLRRAIAERASPGKGAAYDYVMAAPVMERLLRARPREWFADFNQILLRCFVDAVEEGRRLQGRSVEAWRYGRYLELEIKHPVGSAIPYLGRYFNVGPYEMSGSTTTVKQTTRRMGPSMRMIADSSDWNKSLANITTGQSGQFLSSHFKDQWDEYYSGKSFPMRFTGIEGDVLRFVPR